jgi:hypothetical protein
MIGFVMPVVLFFLPVVHTYGLSFFDYYGDNSQLSLRLVLRSISVKLWGYFGAIGLIIAFGYALIFRKKVYDKKIILICSVVIVLYVLAFLKLPHETAYLLPIVPFVLIMLDRFVTNQKVILIACILIGINSFLDINPRGVFSPVYDDKMKKIAVVKESEKIMQKLRALADNKGFILVASYYRPMYRYLYEEINGQNTYREISCQELIEFQQKGVHIFALDSTFIGDCDMAFIDLSSYQLNE